MKIQTSQNVGTGESHFFRFSRWGKSLAVLLFATCVTSWTASGQTYTYTYRFDVSVGYSGGSPTQLRYDVQPDVNAQALFSGSSSEQWKQLLESGYVLGTGTSLTRGQDISEDFHFNWINPEVSDRNYYDHWWISGENLWVSSISYPRTLANQGPHAGESIMGNINLLAMGDDNFLFWDPDLTLSLYDYPGGTLSTDYTWTAFTGGYWTGETLGSKLHLLIGYEEGYLFFLEGDSTVVQYNLNGTTGGNSGRAYNLTLSGDLAGFTLGDVVDGRADGFTYIGWDLGPVIIGVNANLPVPEPSTTLLSLMGLITVLFFRRKRVLNGAC